MDSKRNLGNAVVLAATVAALLGAVVSGGCDRQDNHWAAFDPARKIMTVTGDTLRLAEGGEPASVTVALLMVPEDTVHVVFTSPDGQTVAYPETLSFPPVDDDWARRLTTDIRAVDDDIAEGRHGDAISVVAHSRDADYDGQGGPAAVPVLVSDDDTAGVLVSESALTLFESDQGLLNETYRVRLQSRPLGDVTITANVAPADPTFHADPSVLVFTPENWDTEQTVTIWSDLDSDDADDSSFVISHGATSTDPSYGPDLAIPSVAVDVFDDTLPPIARVRIADASRSTLSEAAAGEPVTVRVSLSHASAVPVTLRLVTIDGTAVAGADYDAFDVDLVFAPGGPLTQDRDVTVIDDPNLEDPEFLTVAVTAADGAIIGEDDRVDIPVLDDDWTTLTMTVADADEDGGASQFVVAMPQAESTPVTFTFTTADGTALAGDDYEAVDETFVIAPGLTQRLIPVVLLADPDHEPDETFSARLTNLSSNAVWNGIPVVATIRDDDPQQVALPDLTVTESDGSAVFRLELDAPYSAPVTLTVSTLDGDGVPPSGGQADAVAGADFTGSVNANWIVPADVTTASYIVPLVSDTAAEALQESFRLRIVTGDQPGFAGLTALCTVIDDDQPYLAMDDVTVDETATEAPFQLRLVDGAGAPVTSTADVSVRVVSEDQTATSPEDYAGLDQIVTVPAGATGVSVPVVLNDDTHDDDSETFVLHLGEPVNALLDTALPDPFCGITDDEFPSINLAMAVDRMNEGSVFEFTIELTTPRQAPTTCYLELLAGGSQGEGVDYTFGQNGAQVIPPFTSSVLFTVPFLDDQLTGETDETLQIELSAANVALGVVALQPVIVDAPELTIASAAALEGDTVDFLVTLDAPSTADVTFRVQYASGTANVGLDIDDSLTGPFTIPAGQTSLVLPVPTIAGDGGDRALETFTTTLISPVNATLSPFNSATGTITDGDPSPLSLAGDASAVEGDDVEFTVNLGWASEADVTFTVVFADGSAVGAGIDYDDSSTGPYTITAGSTSLTIAVPTTADGGPEVEAEDFTITLANPTDAVLGAPVTATGRVLDGDQPVLTIPVGDTVTEGGVLSFTVQMDRMTVVPVFFDLEFLDGSTQGASDFTAPSGPFSMMPGRTDTTITVPTVEDAVFENQEAFIVRIGADPTNAVPGAPDQANGVIDDDD